MFGNEGVVGWIYLFVVSEVIVILEGLEWYCGMLFCGKKINVYGSFYDLEEYVLNFFLFGVYINEYYNCDNFLFKLFDFDYE